MDRCRGCRRRHIDLSREAFKRIAPLAHGRVKVRWRYVACSVDGGLTFHFKRGSSRYWAGIQVRNSRYAVRRLEVFVHGRYRPLKRGLDNHFVGRKLGPGPYRLRVTDVKGHRVVVKRIPLRPGRQVQRDAQFPQGS